MHGYSALIPLASCQQTCMTYTIAVCTVKNCWWLAEELSEMCRVSFQTQIWEISASSWFYCMYLSRCTVTLPRSRPHAVSKPVWHIPLLCVWWKTADDGQRYCPKHVEFYSKNKFEKLVHPVASCQQTCMTHTIAVCTVKNCWWWTEELSETCRVLFQK